MRRPLVVSAIVGVVVAAGCASSNASQVAPPEAPSTSPCAPTGPIRASPTLAVLVSRDGAVCWQHPLPDGNLSSQPSPVASDTLGYFAVGSHVEAVSLRDGRTIWSWSGHPTGGLAGVDPYALGLDGMWLGGGVVAVSEAGTIVGLDARTGSKRWSRKGLGASRTSVTPHGGLVTKDPDGSVKLVDLASGHVRWSSPQVSFSAIGPDAVLVAAGDRLEALDEQTGARRWAWTSPFGSEYALQVDQGLALVGYQQAPVLIAVNLATGRERWRFQAPLGVWASATGPDGIAVDVGAYGRTTELDLLDPGTGLARWHQPTPSLRMPVLAGHDLVGIRETFSNEPVALVDRSTYDGAVRWERPIPHASATSRFGALVAVRSDAASVFHDPLVAHRLSDGGEEWRLDLAGGQVAATVDLPGGLLIEAATASNLGSQGH